MTATPRWPFPKSLIEIPTNEEFHPGQRDELLPYFKYAMDRWNLPDDVRAVAWLNAGHDFVRALWTYRAIWIMDQLRDRGLHNASGQPQSAAHPYGSTPALAIVQTALRNPCP